jgi:hypothetical protein
MQSSLFAHHAFFWWLHIFPTHVQTTGAPEDVRSTGGAGAGTASTADTIHASLPIDDKDAGMGRPVTTEFSDTPTATNNSSSGTGHVFSMHGDCCGFMMRAPCMYTTQPFPVGAVVR